MSENRQTRRRVTLAQLEELWEFLDSNTDIAMGYNKTIQARQHSKNKWQEVTLSLNAHGDGAYKSWQGWSSYWVDYKSKLKKLAAANRASQQRAGGGPARKELTDLEKKFLGLLGEGFGCGIPGARVEPILDETNNMDQDLVALPMLTPPPPVSPILPTHLTSSAAPPTTSPSPPPVSQSVPLTPCWTKFLVDALPEGPATLSFTCAWTSCSSSSMLNGGSGKLALLQMLCKITQAFIMAAAFSGL